MYKGRGRKGIGCACLLILCPRIVVWTGTFVDIVLMVVIDPPLGCGGEAEACGLVFQGSSLPRGGVGCMLRHCWGGKKALMRYEE